MSENHKIFSEALPSRILPYQKVVKGEWNEEHKATKLHPGLPTHFARVIYLLYVWSRKWRHPIAFAQAPSETSNRASAFSHSAPLVASLRISSYPTGFTLFPYRVSAKLAGLAKKLASTAKKLARPASFARRPAENIRKHSTQTWNAPRHLSMAHSLFSARLAYFGCAQVRRRLGRKS